MTASTSWTTGDDVPAKAIAYVGGVALLAAVLTPIRQNWRPRPRDGFPLSYYPMFSVRRKRTGTVVHLVSVDSSGRSRVLHHRYAGTGGLNQVRRQINRTVRVGRAQDLADVAARSVAATAGRATADFTEVRVQSSRFAYDEFFAGQRVPESETVHAVARVQRAER